MSSWDCEIFHFWVSSFEVTAVPFRYFSCNKIGGNGRQLGLSRHPTEKINNINSFLVQLHIEALSFFGTFYIKLLHKT